MKLKEHGKFNNQTLQTSRFKFQNVAGQSALELIIALGVLVFSISASLVVAFGNQAVSVDTGTNGEALLIAGNLLDKARADSKETFNSINSASSVESLYTSKLQVSDINQCKKEISSVTTWNTSPSRSQEVKLSTVFADTATAVAVGSDCGPDGVTSEWKNPTTIGSVDFDPSGNQGTDVDTLTRAGNKIAFVTSKTGSAAKHDFWVVDVNDPSAPFVIGSVNTGPGLVALDVAGDYAFVANSEDSDQLQVIDTSDLANPVVVAAISLPGVDPAGSYPGGHSIYYYNSIVYVGTKETAGNEFHAFDVSDPENPAHLGSIEITHNVNKIVVRDEVVSGSPKTVAYLATSSDTEEVIVLDVTNAASISQIGSFDAQTDIGGPSNEDGTAMYVLGNRVYLGRERATSANEKDFYILDITDPTTPTTLGSKRLNLNPNTKVSGIVVTGIFMFVATTDSTSGFHVWVTDSNYNIIAPSDCNLYNYSEKATGIDFMDNHVYISNESNNALRVIWDNILTSCGA